MHANKNIVLIGMPGVGKSTVGVLLAKRLGYSFLDTDIYIQAREGVSLQELILQHGTSGFCDIEAHHLGSISVEAHVIATGGSVVYREQAMKHLRADGSIIHLDLELPRLQKRLDDIEARGVVITSDQNLADLYKERHLLYNKYADITIRTDYMTPDQVVNKIYELLSYANVHR